MKAKKKLVLGKELELIKMLHKMGTQWSSGY